MPQRLVPAVSLAVLAVLTIVLWLMVFNRSSTSPSATEDGGGNEPADVVTATPAQGASRTRPTTGPSEDRTRSAAPSSSGTPTRSPTASPTTSPSDAGTSPAPEPQVTTASTALTATPFETVPVRGVAAGVPAGTQLRVQYLQAERWRSFPVSTTTRNGGRFTAYVDLGLGTHQLRVLDPGSGAASPIITLVVA